MLNSDTTARLCCFVMFFDMSSIHVHVCAPFFLHFSLSLGHAVLLSGDQEAYGKLRRQVQLQGSWSGALVWKLRQGGMQDLHRRRGAGRWLRLEQIRERQQLQVGLGPRLCPRSSPVLLLKRGNEPHNRGLGMHFCLGLVLKVTSRVIFFAPLALDAYQARGNRGLTQTQGRLIAGFYLFDTRLRHGLSGITIRVCCRICVCIVYTFAVGCLKRLRTTVNNHHP
jgi:hypothetical protein